MNDLIDIKIEDLSDLSIDWNIGGIADPLGQIANYIVSTIGGYINTAIARISSTVSNVINSIIGNITSLVNQAIGGITYIRSVIGNIPSQIASALSGIISNIQSIVNRITSQVASSLAGISGSISSAFSSVLSSINSVLSGVRSALSGIVSQIQSILSGLSITIINTIHSISSTFSSIGSQILAGVSSAFSQVTGVLNQLYAGLKGLGSEIIAGIQSGLTQIWNGIIGVGTQIISGISSAFNTFSKVIDEFSHSLTQTFKPVIDALTGFGQYFTGEFLEFMKDPLGFLKTGLKDIIKLPDEFLKFVTLGVKVFDKFLEEHSPSALDDLINGITTWFGLFTHDTYEILKTGASGGIGFLLAGLIDVFFTWKKDVSGKWTAESKPNISLNPAEGITDYFNSILTNALDSLKTVWASLTKAFNDAGTFVISEIVQLTGSQKYDQPTKDPFTRLTGLVMGSLQDLAVGVTTPTPIDLKEALIFADGVATTTIFTELLEYAGLEVDAVHPIKNLQLKDKFEKFFSKIGLGNVTAVIGATLVGASLSPFFTRYWNKISKVRLPDVGALIGMWERGFGTENDLDEYMAEHGYDEHFRDGLKELRFNIPSINELTVAYLRFVNDGKITLEKALSDITGYMKYHHIRDTARSTFSFSEQEILLKLLYRGISRYERRNLNLQGVLTELDLRNILRADRAPPDYLDKMVKGELLLSTQTFRNAIASKINERVQKGFMLKDEFTKGLQDISFNTTMIGFIDIANQYDILTSIDEARLKEIDLNYTQGVIEKPEYEKTITDIIKNDMIRKEHIAIADIARDRWEDSSVRDEGNRVLTQAYLNVSSGFSNTSDIATLSKTLGRTDKEIALIRVASDNLVASKMRQIQFKTLQSRLAKNRLSKKDFIAQATALKIDPAYVGAVAEYVYTQSLTKLKVSA